MSQAMRRLILAAALMLIARTAAAADGDFSTWLQGLRADAMAQGITAATLDRALTDVQPIPRIIELDRAQPETTLTFPQYIDRIVPSRLEAAREHYHANKALLDAIGQRYGVPPRYIVALWGIETNFGRSVGRFPEIAALATLAYDGRRAAFFREQLINALQIVQDDGIDPHSMIGSWAGAMGQSQFMPSSFLRYAVSYSGKGPPDIWNRPEDVFASIANYLAKCGWEADRGWGEAVRLPAGFDPSSANATQKHSLAEWAALGVLRSDGSALPATPPQSNIVAALLQPAGGDGPSFLVYDNFNVLLRWNNSNYFAIAVGYLADSIN